MKFSIIGFFQMLYFEYINKIHQVNRGGAKKREQFLMFNRFGLELNGSNWNFKLSIYSGWKNN